MRSGGDDAACQEGEERDFAAGIELMDCPVLSMHVNCDSDFLLLAFLSCGKESAWSSSPAKLWHAAAGTASLAAARLLLGGEAATTTWAGTSFSLTCGPK